MWHAIQVKRSKHAWKTRQTINRNLSNANMFYNDPSFIYVHLPSTLDPWFSPDGNSQSGVEWLPLSMICSWPLKGSSGQPAIRRPPWLNERVQRELTKLVHIKSLVLLGVMILKCQCQFECSYVLTWMEIYVAFRTMLLYWDTLPVEVPLFVSGISRTPTIFSLFREGTTTSTTIQMPLRQNEKFWFF